MQLPTLLPEAALVIIVLMTILKEVLHAHQVPLCG
jgi:hypothetical protein